MHPYRLAVRYLVAPYRHLARDTRALAEQVDVGVLATAVRSQHVDFETEVLIKVDEERLKLLCRRVLRAREKHAAVIRVMVDKVVLISIAEAILRRHRALKV